MNKYTMPGTSSKKPMTTKRKGGLPSINIGGTKKANPNTDPSPSQVNRWNRCFHNVGMLLIVRSLGDELSFTVGKSGYH